MTALARLPLATAPTLPAPAPSPMSLAADLRLLVLAADGLLKLAEFGETKIPEERFDYGTFVDYGDDFSLEPSCQTSGCMFGWATAIPEFRAAGLAMINRAPMFEGKSFIHAAAEFFGLQINEAEFLFPHPPLRRGAPPVSNILTIANAVELHTAKRAHLGNTAPVLGRDYAVVEIPGVKCPSCHGTGEHKGAVPDQCGVCLGSGKAYERRGMTEVGEQLQESGL